MQSNLLTADAIAIDNMTEYVFGKTAYIVTLYFNTDGESLFDTLGRLIGKTANPNALAEEAAEKHIEKKSGEKRRRRKAA